MSFSQAIVAIHNADSAITAIIAGRIFALEANQGEAKPYVGYSITNDEDPSPHSEGPSLFRRTSFDLICVAETYAACRALAEAVDAKFRGYGPATIASRKIEWIRFEDESDVEQAKPPGQEKPLYVKQMIYRAMHKASS